MTAGATFLSQRIEQKQADGLCFSVKKLAANGLDIVLILRQTSTEVV